MNACRLVADLKATGIELGVRDGVLRARGPQDMLTAEILQVLKANRDSILAAVSEPVPKWLNGAVLNPPDADCQPGAMGPRVRPPLTLDQQEVWDERMAICTIDGGLTEAEAEAVAWEQLEAEFGPSALGAGGAS
jgi:hypothetical protein